MLLSIDPEKVRQQLATPQAYTVTSASTLENPPIHFEPMSVNIYSTTSAMPLDMERARARLLSLRKSLIESGIKPLSTEALEREIDETRGRS